MLKTVQCSWFFSPQVRGLAEGRGPDFATRLATRGEIAPVGHCATPVRVHDLPPARVTGDLPGPRGAVDFWDGGVGVQVGQRVLAGEQPVEAARPVVALHKVQVLLLAGKSVTVGPDFQHAAGLKVEDVVHLLPAELPCPAVKPAAHFSATSSACSFAA